MHDWQTFYEAVGCWELYQLANVCSWTAVLQIYAVDESPEAVAWAKLNVQRLGLTDRIQVRIIPAQSSSKPGAAQVSSAHKASGSSSICAVVSLICTTASIGIALQCPQ